MRDTEREREREKGRERERERERGALEKKMREREWRNTDRWIGIERGW